MNLKMNIRIVLIQSALTPLFIFAWNWSAFGNIEQAVISSTVLMLFIGIYGLALGVLLLGRVSGILKMVIVSFLTSLFVTVTFVIYPDLGLVVEWYVLFVLLFIAGLMAYGLSYEPQRSNVYEQAV